MLIRTLSLLVMASALAPAGAPAAAPAHRGGQRACAPPPTLALPPGFRDPQGIFGPNSRAFRSVERRFAAAYRIACRKGGLGTPLMRPGASDPRRLFLKNAPSANTVSIYQEDFEAERPAGAMVIEYPFIGDDGRSHLPSVEELRSAIVCSNYYANPSAGDVLECLVD